MSKHNFESNNLPGLKSHKPQRTDQSIYLSNLRGSN